MKVVIFAGGFGTRFSEETHSIPKPMIEIGGKPILWHIMKIYSKQGFNDFIICCGYKAHAIKEYFLNFSSINSDFTVNTKTGKISPVSAADEDWNVTLVDTGLKTQTGGRLRSVAHLLGQRFLLTYGDGVSDVDLNELVRTHEQTKAEVTLTSVQPEGRYGSLMVVDGRVTSFQEKPKGDNAWINGGFMVCEHEFLHRITDDLEALEDAPLMSCAEAGKLFTHKHDGFWASMDTKRDHERLNSLWETNCASWKIW